MKLYEYMGKELLAVYDIAVPRGIVIRHPREAADAFSKTGPAVMKAQVLSGKRGKAGGIVFVNNSREAQIESERLLNMKISGFKVASLLVEKQLQIETELYLSILIDGRAGCPVVLASNRGGMDIEEVPEEYIVKYLINPAFGLQSFMVREICRRLGLRADLAVQFATLLSRLYRLFKEKDGELVEINPLVLSKDGEFIAADAKVTIDDDALFRHKSLARVEERTEVEKKAHELGLAFVELDGDIAVMANGAGMAMATLDMIHYYGGRPANFLDAGGGAGVEQTAQALLLLLANKPKVIMINIFGGITRCDDVAKAFAQVKREKNINVPVVFRLVGTNEEAGRKILESIGVSAYSTMRETAQKAVGLAG